MKNRIKTNQQRQRRARRTRAHIATSDNKPRLTVFRSLKFIYAQIIDDSKGVTLVAASSREVKKDKLTKTEIAKEVGTLLATRASEKKIKVVAFDRGSYQYHGRVKALAEAARAGGLKF